MIKYHRKINENMDEIHNTKHFSVLSITTGGKAEGTALYFESDIDRLYVVKGVAAMEPDVPDSSPTLFYLERSGCSPGYTRLKLVKISESHEPMTDHLVEDQDEFYISNEYNIFNKNAYMIDINGVRIDGQGKNGPSAPYGNKTIKYDFVFAFKCICFDLIKRWAERPRHFEWPDQNLVQQVTALEGHAVPVANKRSAYPKTEWRICYTKAEILLMHSLTDFQTKLYILLKHIAKAFLKSLCSEMTSYIMKNVVFWLIETNPQEQFSPISDRETDRRACPSKTVLVR